LIFFSLFFLQCFCAYNWTTVENILNAGIKNGAFPGCVCAVGFKGEMIYKNHFGYFTYGENPPETNYNPAVTFNTLYDMASCTKVLGATQAVAQFYQRGQMSLLDPITKYLGDEYARNGKSNITVLNCLLHNAGYPPDPVPDYYSVNFTTCPTNKEYNPPENFGCQIPILQSLLNQTLMNPVGAKYVYSDLSFITLMYVVGNLAENFGYVRQNELRPGCFSDNNGKANYQCFFEKYVEKYIFGSLGMNNSYFLPDKSLWKNCAPGCNDPVYRHRVVQGQVGDSNTYAMGGISGHAGIFTDLEDSWKFMHRQMYPKNDDFGLNKTTLDFFQAEYNHSQSSRALGWNTNDPTVFDEGWGLLCGDLSPKTFMHVGFSGTEFCGDPVNDIITIFHTNRIYPNASNEKVLQVRRDFNTAVKKIIDTQYRI